MELVSLEPKNIRNTPHKRQIKWTTSDWSFIRDFCWYFPVRSHPQIIIKKKKLLFRFQFLSQNDDRIGTSLTYYINYTFTKKSPFDISPLCCSLCDGNVQRNRILFFTHKHTHTHRIENLSRCVCLQSTTSSHFERRHNFYKIFFSPNSVECGTRGGAGQQQNIENHFPLFWTKIPLAAC